jgi:hypothetical protein
MTADEKLAAILAAVQTDPGNRGLGKVPGDNLFTACPGDFAAACRSFTGRDIFRAWVLTGFYIPSADPAGYETDGPLGALFLLRAFDPVGGLIEVISEPPVMAAVGGGRRHLGLPDRPPWPQAGMVHTHKICLERPGRAADGGRYTMGGLDVSAHFNPRHTTASERAVPGMISVGIGDGGNEIGMGKVPHETVVANIPNGDLIHCRVPTDYLIVAGVSNWGAYALAAGVYVLRGATPPADLFDPDREREILEVMVREGPLVDGVTGKQTATVDGLSWEEYAKPLVRIREILGSR